MKLTGGKNQTPLLLSVLILALLFALFYYVVKPKMDESESLSASVTSLESELTTIQTKIETMKTELATQSDNGFAIRKKLPDNREVGSLLRNFEEIEFITGTRITNISFNGYDSLVSSSGIKDPNAPAEETVEEEAPQNDLQELTEQSTNNEGSENTSEDTAVEGEEVPVTTIAQESLPPNLKLLTYSLNIEAPDAEKLLLFIKEVERLERVMHVDTIAYSLPGEEEEYTPDEEKGPQTVTLTVTTFYYE